MSNNMYFFRLKIDLVKTNDKLNILKYTQLYNNDLFIKSMADFNHNRRSTLLLGDLPHTRLSIGMDAIFTQCRNMRASGPGHKDD